MRVITRVDASSQIGIGHVMRCLTLADAFSEQGAKCEFVCREHDGHLMDHIRFRGYQVHALTRPAINASFTSELEHASWLGVDWQTDAAQTRQSLGSKVLDWLIVDHYALDHRWESALRSSFKHIMVIDDLADRQHDCDLLLDQNYGSSAELYRGLIPSDCVQCHGPEYALLKPVYAERRAQLPVRDGQVHRVLIYFGGGADMANLVCLAVHAFQVPELAHIELDIVVGASFAHQLLLEELVAQRGKATIHQQLSDLADLMAKADLAIGAGGATTWERCCMGLPVIVISIAENQRPASEALAKDDLIHYLGHVDVIRPEVIREQVLELLGCGGTTARHVEEGDTVHLVVMADGVHSRRGSSKADFARRIEASKRAQSILGISFSQSLELPDNKMDSIPLLEIVQKLESILAEIRPSIVYTHHHGDLNIDHRLAHAAVMTACRPLPDSSVREIYGFEVLSSTEWAIQQGSPFLPDYFVEITEQLRKKLDALEAYAEEMRKPPHSRSMAHAEVLAHHRGYSIGVHAAEAFEVYRIIR